MTVAILVSLVGYGLRVWLFPCLWYGIPCDCGYACVIGRLWSGIVAIPRHLISYESEK